MNLRAVGFFLGNILRLEAIFMIPALAVALLYGESTVSAFIITIGVIVAISCILLLQKPSNMSIQPREGFVTVAVAWVLISLLGALPFRISGAIPYFVDALFETVSGFTTTGATILIDVEVLPRSLLYWRSFTHWLGGMGVLVFMLAVAPQNSGSGDTLHLMRAESPGPVVGKLVPRIHRTARILYIIYIVLTLVQIPLLLIGGMPFLDSICIALGTAGTGGFAITNISIAAYNSSYLQILIGIFMTIFGVNFGVYYLLLTGEVRQALRSEELRAYLGIMLGASCLITMNVASQFSGIGEAFRHSFFQVSSVMTTTGFATVDFNVWPQFSRFILLVLMILGASAGSTGGGIKIVRVVILWRAARGGLQKMLHPRSVKVIKMEDKVIDDSIMAGVNGYMTIYCIIAGVSIALLALENFSLETTLSAVISCINNIGPGLDMVGPMGNYAAFSAVGKLLLAANMLIGRLEIFPMLILFAPSAWKRGH